MTMSLIPSHTPATFKIPKVKVWQGLVTDNMMYDTYKCFKTVADTVKQHLTELGQCTWHDNYLTIGWLQPWVKMTIFTK